MREAYSLMNGVFYLKKNYKSTDFVKHIKNQQEMYEIMDVFDINRLNEIYTKIHNNVDYVYMNTSNKWKELKYNSININCIVSKPIYKNNYDVGYYEDSTADEDSFYYGTDSDWQPNLFGDDSSSSYSSSDESE